MKLFFLFIAQSIGLLAFSQSWNLTGNAGTSSSTNFVGTTDNQSLLFRVNNLRAGMIHNANGNTSFGLQALQTSTEGIYNTAIGNSALLTNSSGAYNSATGAFSLYSNTTGHSNSATGGYALYSNTTGYTNSSFGMYSLYANTTGSSNTSVGYGSQQSNATGYSNTSVGYRSLYTGTSGIYNVAVGANALYSTSGGYNVAVGASALYFNTSGTSNLAVGYSAIYNNTTGIENTGIGNQTLRANTTGGYNVAVGSFALLGNTTGSNNVAFGPDASSHAGTGNYNVAIGGHSLFWTSAAEGNTAVGYSAGSAYNNGYYNTLIGAFSDVNAAGRYNCVTLGQGIVCTANSQARIGNAATTSIGGYVGWSNISDGRYKRDVQQNVKGLEFIMKLQPVTYHLKLSDINKKLAVNHAITENADMKKAIAEKEKMLYSGFIAQDVEKAADETGYDFSGVDKPKNQDDLYGLRYAEFVVPLVKAVQEQQTMINELIKQNSELQSRITELEKNTGISTLSAANNNDELKVWPNPANKNLFANITATDASKAVIKVYDNKGALVKQQQISLSKGNNQLTIDMEGLAIGMYQLSVEWNNGQVKKAAQVVKQ